MLLKANGQNLGHGAVGEYGLLLSLGLQGSACPGSPRERRRRGRGGEAGLRGILSGDAGNWQADERAWAVDREAVPIGVAVPVASGL